MSTKIRAQPEICENVANLNRFYIRHRARRGLIDKINGQLGHRTLGKKRKKKERKRKSIQNWNQKSTKTRSGKGKAFVLYLRVVLSSLLLELILS